MQQALDSWEQEYAGASDVVSPCTRICRIDESSGWCEGCWRTLDEITVWRSLDDNAKRAVMQRIVNRKNAKAP